MATDTKGWATPAAAADLIWKKAAGRSLALFLDFDGTLTPIVDRPDAARLDAASRAALAAAAARHRIAIVSGRALADLRTRIDLAGIILAGSHGYEIDGDVPSPPAAAPEHAQRINQAAALLRSKLAAISGVEIEDKRFAVAIHWRHVAATEVPSVESAVDTVARELGSLRKTHGRCVFELRPDLDWDKGRVTVWILEALPGSPMPVFVGDDVTDLDGLAAMRGRGIGVVVGEVLPPDAGALRLPDPDAVRQFLQLLADGPDGRAQRGAPPIA